MHEGNHELGFEVDLKNMRRELLMSPWIEMGMEMLMVLEIGADLLLPAMGKAKSTGLRSYFELTSGST
jgi:hypothetical protein